jgi:hypothetical protein
MLDLENGIESLTNSSRARDFPPQHSTSVMAPPAPRRCRSPIPAPQMEFPGVSAPWEGEAGMAKRWQTGGSGNIDLENYYAPTYPFCA